MKEIKKEFLQFIKSYGVIASSYRYCYGLWLWLRLLPYCRRLDYAGLGGGAAG
jgi:hypothetical protein